MRTAECESANVKLCSESVFEKFSDEEMPEMSCDEYPVRTNYKKKKEKKTCEEKEGGKLTTTTKTTKSSYN